MLSPHAVQTPPTRRGLTISDSSMRMGLLNVGARGSGKTTLQALLALQHLHKGRAQVIIDPLGTLSESLLFLLLRSLQRVPMDEHAEIWRRLSYIDVGNTESVTPFPIYYRRGAETLREVAERFIDTLRLANPALIKNAPISWPSLRKVGINTGMVLAALGYQLTEAEDLLIHTGEWEKKGLFAEAIRRNPEAIPAVAYFREQYLPLSRAEKSRLISSFLDHVFSFALDPKLRLLFGASTPGINWEDVEKQNQTVILDFRNVTDPEARRFALLWVFQNLYEHIKARGRRHTTLGLIIDEFAELAQQVTDSKNPLAVRFDEFLQRYMRNNNIFFSCAFQSIKQIDDHLRHTLLSLGTHVVGKVAEMEEARLLADVLFQTDPYFVKHWRKVWGTETLVSDSGRIRGHVNVVLDHEPEHMPLPEQLELAAQQLRNLGVFHFLCRPALREGEVSQAVIPISIAGIVRDRKTGEYVIPDAELGDRVRSRLAARSGIPAATIRAEQESRLRQGPIHAPQPAVPRHMPPEGNGRQPFTQDNGAHPEPQTVRETQSRPALADTERAFLAFLMEHPDTPVSLLSKELRIRAEQATMIRESLKAKGFLVELEVRTAGTTAGRPTKFVIPTLQAFELLVKEPPAGRGGVIHRHLQQMIAQSATDKGYTAKLEKQLATGAIVDVHVERGGERVAVEIAVMSHPSREMAHIRQCLDAGYAKVCTVFADPQLLEKTKEALGVVFADAELSRIQLMPISKLAGVG